MESSIWVWGKNHFSRSVYDTIFRVSGQVVEEVVDGLIGDLSVFFLLSNYGIEVH